MLQHAAACCVACPFVTAATMTAAELNMAFVRLNT